MSGGDASGDVLVSIENITGSAFDDSLAGNALANVLTGGDGNDILFGAEGADALTGGSGADTFVFKAKSDSAPGAADIITDFTHGSDTINLSAIDANTAAIGNQTFGFVGLNSHVVVHSVSWFESGGNTIVQADVNGNTTADFTIVLDGINHHLTTSDFIL